MQSHATILMFIKSSSRVFRIEEEVSSKQSSREIRFHKKSDNRAVNCSQSWIVSRFTEFVNIFKPKERPVCGLLVYDK